MNTLDISDTVQIPLSEIRLSAIRAQGAGGQNVNKVASAIHLRFDALQSDSIPDRAKARLLHLTDQRISSQGVIVIKSQAYRSQDRNRQAALRRLAEIVLHALRERSVRVRTQPGKKAARKRLDAKSKRGALKRLRRIHTDE